MEKSGIILSKIIINVTLSEAMIRNTSYEQISRLVSLLCDFCSLINKSNPLNHFRTLCFQKSQFELATFVCTAYAER